MTASHSHSHRREAWTSWLSCLPLCCAPLPSSSSSSSPDKRQGRSKSLSSSFSRPLPNRSDEQLLISQVDEKKLQHPVVYDQPFYQPRPVAAPGTPLSSRDIPRRTDSNRSNASKRKRFWPSTTPYGHRSQISAPFDFRHISSAAPQFSDEESQSPEPTPTPQPPRQQRDSQFRPAKQLRPRSFRPLSIGMQDSQISPILPHFEVPAVTPPPPAYTRESSDDDLPLMYRFSSSSSSSFHPPLKHGSDSSPDSYKEGLPPMIPPRAKGRPRAYTSPDVDAIRDRVAEAMIEMERLQRQIDDVIERQSLYLSSRPSTGHSMAHTMPDLEPAEPMPSVPALPPAAPSFAERLASDIVRPHTAPIKSPLRSRTPEEVTAALKAPPKIRRDDGPLPPPLPLVLRPPLRKKKSFSRVSSWLFPGADHNRELSFDSVTNVPRPVKGSEGYYQCVSQGEVAQRRSTDTYNTGSTWETDDERTIPTTMTPGSTPATKQEGSFMSRTATSGKSDSIPKRTSVGVAM